MTSKADLAKAVQAAVSGLTLAQAEKATNAVFARIESAMRSGDEARVHGFGSFKPKLRAAREARNPKNGEKIHVPAKRSVGFKAATALNAVL